MAQCSCSPREDASPALPIFLEPVKTLQPLSAWPIIHQGWGATRDKTLPQLVVIASKKSKRPTKQVSSRVWGKGWGVGVREVSVYLYIAPFFFSCEGERLKVGLKLKASKIRGKWLKIKWITMTSKMFYLTEQHHSSFVSIFKFHWPLCQAPPLWCSATRCLSAATCRRKQLLAGKWYFEALSEWLPKTARKRL